MVGTAMSCYEAQGDGFSTGVGEEELRRRGGLICGGPDFVNRASHWLA